MSNVHATGSEFHLKEADCLLCTALSLCVSRFHGAGVAYEKA